MPSDSEALDADAECTLLNIEVFKLLYHVIFSVGANSNTIMKLT